MQFAHSKGFTLAELAVAFVIIGLLLAGALLPLSTQMELKNITDTRRIMDQVKEALIGYALSNGRLPCPACPTLPDAPCSGSTAASGAEMVSGNSCVVQVGVVPWATLGIPETDAWGRRFTYRVASIFSDSASSTTTYNTTSPASQSGTLNCTAPSPTPTLSSYALCSLGDMAVLKRTRDPFTPSLITTTPVGTGLSAVFLSHGKNGNGAYQTTGKRLVAAAANTDEKANSDGTTTATPTGSYLSYVFYSRDQTPEQTGCSDTAGTVFCEFDDIVYIISSSTLIAKTVNAGRLP